jgi:hypothetical protein
MLSAERGCIVTTWVLLVDAPQALSNNIRSKAGKNKNFLFAMIYPSNNYKYTFGKV